MFIHSQSKRSLRYSLLVLTSFFVSLGGCAVAPTESSAHSSHSALDQGGGDPVDDDEALAFVKNNGFGAIVFAVTCVSKATDGSTIDGDSLPVGGGRWLECSTAESASRSAMSVLSSKEEEWCAFGQVSAFHPGGDSRLTITVTSTPSDAPWTLTATHDGDPIQITRVEASGAMTWPLWVNATYSTTELAHATPGKSCEL
jgi:hypothetical protein